jgi:nucleolar protein 14
MNKNFKRGLSKGALDPESKTWPGSAELSLLRVIGTIWPTSDMNHAVVSPARILMGAYLGLGRVRSLRDIASGLFLCTLFLQYEQLSQRFVPEAVNFLVNTILHLGIHGYKDVSQLPGSFSSPDFRSELCLPLTIDSKKAKKIKIVKPDLAALLSTDESSQADKVNLFALALDLTARYANLYKGLDAFVELFEPISEILQKLQVEKLGEDLQVSI